MIPSNASNQEIIQRLSDHLETHLENWFPPEATLDTDGYTVEMRHFSFLIRYEVHGANCADEAIFVRIPRKPQFDALAQAVQADAELKAETKKYLEGTTAIANAFAGTDFCYIRPLGSLPSFNAVVTEEVRSRSLRDLFDEPNMIVGRKKSDQAFAGYLQESGRWLRYYHQRVGKSSVETLSHADAITAVDHDIDKLAMWTEKAVDLTWLRRQCYALAETVAGRSVSFARLHGDFHYANILLAKNGRVGGIDANAGTARRAIYVDIAKLIIDPLTIKRQWISYGLTFSPRRAQPFTDAILRGYFQQQYVDRELLTFYMLLALMDKWTYLEKRLKTSADSDLPSKTIRALSPLWRRYFQRLSRLILTSELGGAPINVK